MIEAHLLKLRARSEIRAEEEEAIRGAISGMIDVGPARPIVRAQKVMDYSTILLSGIACRRKDLRDGRSQITELHVAGDFVDLHSFTLKYLDHDVVALTHCRLATVPHDRLRELTERFPHLARVYWFGTNLDAAIHREWELSLGRRAALARMAHLFCEMYIRLKIVGLTRDYSYDLPLTQEQLAESLGLTAVHVNRTLQQLRRDNAIAFERGQVVIKDLERLEEIAEFDPAYLYLERRER